MIAKQDHDEVDTQGVVHHFGKGQVKGVWEAPDHPCVGQGGDEREIPHPFANWWSVPLPPHLEIALLDNRQLAELQAKVTRNRTLPDVMLQQYHIEVDAPEVAYTPREIIEIDERGEKQGEVIAEMDTPEFAKSVIRSDKIQLKRRMVTTLPQGMTHRRLAQKS